MRVAAVIALAGCACSSWSEERLADAPALAIEYPPPERPVGWSGDYFSGLPGDAMDLVAAPGDWRTAEWSGVGLLVGTVAAAYLADNGVRAWAQAHRTREGDDVARVVKPFGREVVVIGLAGFAVVSPFVDDRRVVRTALLGSESLLVAGAGYAGLQLATRRPRPNSGEDHDFFGGGSGQAFPSGHTTAAFAFAGVLAHEWGDVPGVAPAAYGIAGLVGLSRINDDAHWASDVVAGAIIGWASATAVEGLYPRRAIIQARPFLERRTGGIAIDWRF